jgi:AGCS family alanine or glycine:cation symporter
MDESQAPGLFAAIEQAIDGAAGWLNDALGAVIFWDGIGGFPLVVLWLVIGGGVFTVWMGFINVRGFAHALAVVRGRYDDPDDAGEVSHFQALSTALSATVGLGNIGGVALAVILGGPGATFWMIVAGLIGMTSKFTECTLGLMYRKVDAEGRVSGGPMHYLADGLAEKGFGGAGRALAVVFAVLCVGASFGGGNMFQVNQSMGAVAQTLPWIDDYNWAYGLILAVAVGIVIIGGIKSIARTAEKIVPLMCVIYVGAALVILIAHASDIPAAFGTILSGAFTPEAQYGGFVGVLAMGFRRAAFSNEAGVGSAAIAHSAARTDEPVREGIVALLEPFIDTVVVCTMTALVIVITGAYHMPGDFAVQREAGNGAALTSLAFAEVITWFPYLLSVAVILFAYSTMISWSYYGERCWVFLFGAKSSIYYKALFLVFVFLGSIVSALNVMNFGDTMILAMSFPNLVGLYVLAPKVKAALDRYMSRLAAREFRTFS